MINTPSRKIRIAEAKMMKIKLENIRSKMGHQTTTYTKPIDDYLHYIDFILKDDKLKKDTEIGWWSLTDKGSRHTFN